MADPVSLWGSGTVRTLRPIWVAEELGLHYKLHPIGPRTGETQTPQYTRLNPKQKIPVLVTDSIVLSESLAICRYLLELSPEHCLYRPQSAIERATEDAWCCYIYGELDETSLYVMRRHGDLAAIYGAAPGVVSAAADYAGRHLDVIAEQLATRDYLQEQGFGLADLMLMTCLDWAVAYKLVLPPVLLSYRQRIASRPAYQRAVAINAGKRL